MEESKQIKEYQNGDLTIVWQASKCIHAGHCVQRLPQVYDPHKKPWIYPEAATVQDLKDQIDLCPSGALTYNIKTQSITKKLKQMEKTKANIKPNGPIILQGQFTITHADGRIEEIEKMAALCRCGASKNKPYCDGAHASAGFKG